MEHPLLIAQNSSTTGTLHQQWHQDDATSDQEDATNQDGSN